MEVASPLKLLTLVTRLTLLCLNTNYAVSHMPTYIATCLDGEWIHLGVLCPGRSHLLRPDSQDTRARLVGRKLEGGAAPLWLHGFAGKLKIAED